MLVHFRGTDLDFQRLAAGPRHRGVQRTVLVALGPRDIVVKLTRQRRPQIVRDTENGVTGLDIRNDRTHRTHVVERGKIKRLAAHLVIDAKKRFFSPL